MLTDVKKAAYQTDPWTSRQVGENTADGWREIRQLANKPPTKKEATTRRVTRCPKNGHDGQKVDTMAKKWPAVEFNSDRWKAKSRSLKQGK